jgi:hypothetical protein
LFVTMVTQRTNWLRRTTPPRGRPPPRQAGSKHNVVCATLPAAHVAQAAAERVSDLVVWHRWARPSHGGGPLVRRCGTRARRAVRPYALFHASAHLGHRRRQRFPRPAPARLVLAADARDARREPLRPVPARCRRTSQPLHSCQDRLSARRHSRVRDGWRLAADTAQRARHVRARRAHGTRGLPLLRLLLVRARA